MPAKQRYPSPGEQLLDLAQQARVEGLSFDEFWDRAVPAPQVLVDRKSGEPLVDEEGKTKIKPSRVLPRVGEHAPGAVLWPRDTRERRDAYEATVGCREGWRRAYDCVPPLPREKALTRLRPYLFIDLDETATEGIGDGRSNGVGVPLPA